MLREQLETYIVHARRHAAFGSSEDIASLSIKMVETVRHVIFPLVCKLIELVLLLPISMTSVEREFPTLNIIKRQMCNKNEDNWMNDLMVFYVWRKRSLIPR
jgi:hypothetical protein